MMKLRINPLVARDLKSIKDFIAEDNEDVEFSSLVIQNSEFSKNKIKK